MTKNNAEISLPKAKGKYSYRGRTGLIDYFTIILTCHTVIVLSLVIVGYYVIKLGEVTNLFSYAAWLAILMCCSCFILLGVVIFREPMLLKSEEHLEKMSKTKDVRLNKDRGLARNDKRQ
jgi:hypothetical protein